MAETRTTKTKSGDRGANGSKRTNRRIGAKEARAAKGGGAATKAPAKKPAAKPRQTKVQKNEAVARQYFDAIAARDPDGMLACWNKEGVEDIVPVGVFRGPGEIKGFFGELFAAMPDSDMKVTRLVPGDKQVAVEWRMTGTFDGGPFLELEPNGKRVDVRGLDMLEIERGKIVRNTGYYDGADFARQLGLLPPRDSGAERAMTSAFNALTKVRRRIDERRA